MSGPRAPPPKPSKKPAPTLPQKPPVIPQKPPVIPKKPGDLPPKPIRANSLGNIGKIQKQTNTTAVPPLPSPKRKSKLSSPRKSSGDSKANSPRPSSKKKGKFKKKLFGTFRSSTSKEPTHSSAPASPPPTSPTNSASSSDLRASLPSMGSRPTLNEKPSVSSAPQRMTKFAPASPSQNNPSYSSANAKLENTSSPMTKPKAPPTRPNAPMTRPKAPMMTPPTNNFESKIPVKPRARHDNPTPEKYHNEQLSELDEKRKKIATEIYTTEEAYVGVLDTLLNFYQKTLYAKAETDEMPTVTKAQILQIFSNVEQLLPMNQHLLAEIKIKIDNWHSKQLIGDIFKKTGPFFKIYNVYGNNYDRAQEVFDKCQADPSFTAQVEIIEAKAKSLRLPNLLIQPIQRVPRYNLLLRDLLAKTDKSHPDHDNLATALETLEQVMSYLDKNITEVENIEKMLKFSSVKGAEALVQPHRQLVQEFSLNIREQDKSSSQVGTFKKKFKSKGLFKDVKLNIWLFNDVLCHLTSTKSKKKTNVASTKHTWPLELVWVNDIPEIEPTDTKLPYSFLLVGPRTTYTLRFPDPQDKLKWMKVFEDAINSCLTDENAPDDKKLCRYGTYVFPDKDRGVYQGWWKFGKIHGQGVYSFYGNKYTGQFEYNKKFGSGTMESSSGEIYQGEWKDDFPHGHGTLLYPNKDRYDGEWIEGYRSGKGTHFYANGDKYFGDWENNLPHGEGHYSTKCGHEYKGGFKNSVFNGSGLLSLPNGKRYEGEFKDGYRHGEGRMDYGNGKFYVGQFNTGRRHGKGMLFCEVEGCYDGDFKEDFKEGTGTMQYSNGDVYVGSWKKNLYQGNGSLTCASGGMISYEGQWDNSMKHGKGVMMYRNGGKYAGHFREDIPHGHGVYTSKEAVVTDGKWEEGRKIGKLSISVGQTKISAQCINSLMDETKIHNFFVFPEPPVVHLHL